MTGVAYCLPLVTDFDLGPQRWVPSASGPGNSNTRPSPALPLQTGEGCALRSLKGTQVFCLSSKWPRGLVSKSQDLKICFETALEPSWSLF